MKKIFARLGSIRWKFVLLAGGVILGLMVWTLKGYAPPPPPSTVTMYPLNVAPASIEEGSTDDFIRFYFLTDQGQAYVTSITVTKAGTIAEGDVQVSLYKSTNNVWDASDTLLAGPQSFVGGVTTFTGLSEAVTDTIQAYYFIVLSVAPGTAGTTAGVNLVDPCFSVDVGAPICTTTDYAPVPVLAAGQVPDVLVVEPYDIAPFYAAPGETDVPVLKLDMYALSNTVVWTALTVYLSGTNAADTDVASVKIYKESGVTPGFQSSEDTLISSGTDVFSGGVTTVDILTSEVIGGTPETYYLVYDVASGANTNANIGATVLSDSFAVASPDVVSSLNLPFSSKEIDIIVPDSTIGTLDYVVSSCNQVVLSWFFTGDENNNSYTYFESSTDATWGNADDVVVCAEVSSVPPRNCTVVGIDLSTTPLYFRAVHYDPDGTSGGTFVTAQTAYVDVGPVDCTVVTGNPPVVNILNPADGTVVAGNAAYPVTVQVSVWDLETAPSNLTVEISVDGGAWDSTGWLYNPNWENVDINLYVYEWPWRPTTPGLHTLAVRARDGDGNAGYAYYNVRVYVNAVTTVSVGDYEMFPGSGLLLVRGGASIMCMSCHNVSTHGGYVWSSTKYGNWAINCRICHVPHGTRNIYLITENIKTPSSGVKSVDFRAITGDPAVDLGLMGNMQDGVDSNVCEVCHTKTTHYKNTNLGDDHGGKDGIDCTACHPHAQGFKPEPEGRGGYNCAICHPDLFQPINTSTTTYHHYLNNAEPIYPEILTPSELPTDTTDRNCLICHADHDIFRPDLNPDNTIGRAANLRVDISTAPTTTSGFTNTDFDSSTGTSICISCPKDVMNKNTTTRNSSDGVTQTIVIDGTAFLSSIHNYTIPMTIATDGSIFNANCIKCHNDTMSPKSSVNAYTGSPFELAPHDSALRWILNPFDLIASDPLEEDFCYKCHSGDVAGKDYFGVASMTARARGIQSQFAKTYIHPITASGRHKTIEGSSYGWLPADSRHVECTDCHNPHKTAQGNHTPGSGGLGAANQGVWGVQITSEGDVYSAGTADFTNGSCTVTGTGTAWTTIPNPTECNIHCTTDTKKINYPIASVDSDTQLTILDLRGSGACYEGSCGAGSSYEIVCPRNLQYARVESVNNQYEICFKCHTPYAWDLTPPVTLSGGPNGQVWAETDVAQDFSTHNLAYHPLFAPGLFQPPDDANPYWDGSAAYGNKATTATACPNANPNAGYDNTFVDCWGKQSLVTCSDCHSTDAPGNDIPEGPHGSAFKWLLRGVDPNVTVTLADGTVIYLNQDANVQTYPRMFCVNCHRADVYFPLYSSSTFYWDLSRYQHDDPNSSCFGTDLVDGEGTRFENPCMNCHGGRSPGQIHGSNLGVGSLGSSPQGFRFMNGSSWVGHTTGLTGGTCYTLSAANDLSTCTQHSTGRSYTGMNFSY